MKFNLKETVVGADITPGAVLLFFPRERMNELFQRLEEQKVFIDAFTADETRGVMAIFPQRKGADFSELLDGVTVETEVFRLTLRGHRLTEGKGLAALWESVLSDAKIPLPLACSNCGGVTHYLPEAARNTVLTLLERTFGIRAV